MSAALTIAGLVVAVAGWSITVWLHGFFYGCESERKREKFWRGIRGGDR